jgi:hypothetical protein
VSDYIPPTTEAMQRLQRDNRLDVVTPFGTWSLSLRGSRLAISEALRCTAQYENYEPSGANQKSLSSRPYFKNEMELALKVLIGLGISDVEFLEPDLGPYAGSSQHEKWMGVNWFNSNGTYYGSATIGEIDPETVPRGGSAMGHFQGGQVEAAKSVCKGSLANIARTKMIGLVEVMENQIVCEDSNGIAFYSFYHSIIDGSLYVEVRSTFRSGFEGESNTGSLAESIPAIAASYVIEDLRSAK